MHAAADKALKKQARLAEADTLRRIAEAAKTPSPQRPTSLFRKSSKFNPSTPSMAASATSTQQEQEAALNLRVAQQQSQEVTWNKRASPKASTGSVALLLSDYDVYISNRMLSEPSMNAADGRF